MGSLPQIVFDNDSFTINTLRLVSLDRKRTLDIVYSASVPYTLNPGETYADFYVSNLVNCDNAILLYKNNNYQICRFFAGKQYYLFSFEGGASIISPVFNDIPVTPPFDGGDVIEDNSGYVTLSVIGDGITYSANNQVKYTTERVPELLTTGSSGTTEIAFDNSLPRPLKVFKLNDGVSSLDIQSNSNFVRVPINNDGTCTVTNGSYVILV